MTQAFLSLAPRAAAVLGYQDLPVVVVGHPVTTLSVEALHAMAERALPDVVAGLTGALAARSE